MGCHACPLFVMSMKISEFTIVHKFLLLNFGGSAGVVLSAASGWLLACVIVCDTFDSIQYKS